MSVVWFLTADWPAIAVRAFRHGRSIGIVDQFERALDSLLAVQLSIVAIALFMRRFRESDGVVRDGKLC
jgi:hypothetical protein